MADGSLHEFAEYRGLQCSCFVFDVSIPCTYNVMFSLPFTFLTIRMRFSIHPEFEARSGQRRRRFLIALSKSLVQVVADDQQPARPVRDPVPVTTVSRRQSKKRCHVCPRQEDRKSAKICRKCGKGLCAQHVTFSCSNC